MKYFRDPVIGKALATLALMVVFMPFSIIFSLCKNYD